MLGQTSDASGVSFFLLLVIFGLVALQVYLIYAIIATRQDVKAILSILGDQSSEDRPLLGVFLVDGGSNPEAVESVLDS
jgi:hypothetical protein